MKELTINIFRVEVNHGSKLFNTALEAFWYFEKMRKRRYRVEMWLITYQRNFEGKLLVTQELVAYD